MERELRQMAAIVESSEDAIVGQNLDGIITSWNKGAERIFGHSSKWIVGQPQSILVPPEHENELQAIRERIQRGEYVDHFETVRKTKDGRRIFVSLTVSPVKDETGKVVGVASIARDITERKKAEVARRTSEENLKRAQAVAHIGSWYLNIPRDELLWSDETYQIFGISPGTPMTYEKFLAVVHPDDRDLVNRAWSAAMRGAPYELEHRIIVGGHTKWIRESAELEFDAEGHVATGIGTAHDITERKQAEEALRASEARTRMILDTANDPFITINARGEILDWNREAELVFGWSREEVLGRTLSETIIPTQHRAAHDRGLQDFLVTGSGSVINTRTELTALRRDRSEFPVELLAWPTHSGGVLTISAFVQDITERKRAEERLRRSNRALLALSSCNKALIRAKDEAELLQQICQIIVEKTGYRLCWVGYADHDEAKTVRPVAQTGFEEEYLQTVNITWADTERGRGPTGTCVRTGQPSVVKEISTDERFTPWRTEALKRGYLSCIAIPLIADSFTLGALSIYAAERNAFADEEVQLLTELASDLAFGVMVLRTKVERKKAVELQAAHDRETKIGSEIQKTLLVDALPTEPHGFRVAALSVPSQQIDGDFYYCYKHDDQRVDLIVADVMGKGIPAALLSAATKSHILEALCHLLNASPAGILPQPKEIVTLAHALMVQHLIDLESFVTLCYVRIDPDRRSIEFVDAGHTGLIHCQAETGRCVVLHGDNLPLGFRKGEVYKQQTVSLDVGDLLVLFSDGVTEMRNRADELFGEDRLTHCIESNRALEPADLVNTIRGAVFAFAESESPTDDLTCVVIKVVESEPPQSRANLTIRSDVSELRRAREFVRGFCSDLPGKKLDEAYVGTIELAVTEACSNIMKHAFHGRTDQQIEMEADGFPDRIMIRLYHLGEPFDPSSVPQPRLDGSQESGFGVYLINRSVDGVQYYRDKSGRNCIALTKNR